MKYLPPFDLIRRMVEVSTVRGELRVSLAYDDFVKILRMMISGIEVDEGWYLKENGDIAQAIAKGAVGSAKQHFVDDGYFEGRRPFPMPVDERWYLEHNADVAESVRKGVVSGGGAAFRRGWLPRGALALRDLDACGNPQICHTEQVGSPVAPCRSPRLGETPRLDETLWGSSVMSRDTLLAFTAEALRRRCHDRCLAMSRPPRARSKGKAPVSLDQPTDAATEPASEASVPAVAVAARKRQTEPAAPPPIRIEIDPAISAGFIHDRYDLLIRGRVVSGVPVEEVAVRLDDVVIGRVQYGQSDQVAEASRADDDGGIQHVFHINVPLRRAQAHGMCTCTIAARTQRWRYA